MRLSGKISLDSGPSNYARPGEYFVPRSAHRHRAWPLHEWRSLLSNRQFSTEERKIPKQTNWSQLVFTVCSIPRCVRDWQLHKFIIPTAMRNEKTVVTNFTKCVIVAFWRHNVCPFRGIWVSKHVHSGTFLLSTRSWKSDFGFSFSALRLHR